MDHPRKDWLMKYSLVLLLAGQALAGFNYVPPRPYIPPPMYFNPNPSGPTLNLDGYLKSGEKISFRSGIYREKDSASYVRLDDSKFLGKADSLRRYVADFDSLVAKSFDYTKHDTLRYKADTLGKDWMFDQIKGRISIYSGYPLEATNRYMKIGDSSIVWYDKDALRRELVKNPSSRGLLNRQTLGNVLNVGMVVAGVVMILAGVSETDTGQEDQFGETKTKTSPLVGIGAATLLGSWIPFLAVSNNFEEAIKAYNK
jgi:hypothetical protein